jgi:Protein of unknown function (DUF3037)
VTGALHVFEYAVLRAVPRVERGESINVGVLVWCKPLGYLGARAHLDRDRLLALDAGADVAAVERALAAVCDVVPGPGPDAGSAAIDEVGRTFRWLTAPRSTVVQPGPVHTGLTTDPDAEADRLFRLLVLPVADGDELPR